MQTVTHIEMPSCRKDHRKVYSGEMLEGDDRPTCTWYWICSECQATGSDDLDTSFRPSVDPPRYWKLMRQLKPNCWVPAAFR